MLKYKGTTTPSSLLSPRRQGSLLPHGPHSLSSPSTAPPSPLGASHSPSCMSVQHRRPWAKSHCLSHPPSLPPAPLRPSSAGPRRPRPPPPARAGLALLRWPAQARAGLAHSSLHVMCSARTRTRASTLVPASWQCIQVVLACSDSLTAALSSPLRFAARPAPPCTSPRGHSLPLPPSN